MMQSLRSIYFYDGRVTMSADLMVALVRRHSDVCKYLQLVESTAKKCTYRTLRSGEPEPTTVTWTWDDAIAADLAKKDNWKKYPRSMLRARCAADICRAVYPDLMMGVYDADSGELTKGDPSPTAHVYSPEAAEDLGRQLLLSNYKAEFDSLTGLTEIREVLRRSKDDLPDAPAQALVAAWAAGAAERVEGGAAK
jgi:hypothetical protein